jgi:multiple sugar transport system permease protein
VEGPRRSPLTRAGRWIVVLGFAALLAFPFYWMAITTFKQTRDLYDLQHNPFVFNAPPTLEHLRLLFEQTLFLRWFLNTTLAGAAVVASRSCWRSPRPGRWRGSRGAGGSSSGSGSS